MLQLEKTVALLRRREAELAAGNQSLEAKVERLTRDVRGCRPVPNSRGKFERLQGKVSQLEEDAAVAHTALTEAAAMKVRPEEGGGGRAGRKKETCPSVVI